MSIDAMRHALEVLERNLLVIEDYGDHEQLNRQHKAITALRAAIEKAQPERQPVPKSALTHNHLWIGELYGREKNT